MKEPIAVPSQSSPRAPYKIGGMAALICAVMYFAALAIYIPAYRASPPPATVSEWFALLQASPLTGLFFLGLADTIIAILWIPLVLALYAALRQPSQAWALIATVSSVVGSAVFLATNVAFAMLFLSNQYAASTTASQQSSLLSAGQAMIAVTEGARMLPLIPLAGLILSVSMLGSRFFSKVTASAGIIGFGFLSASGLFAGYATAVPTSTITTLIVGITYAGGGLLSLAWYISVGLTLLRHDY